MNSDADELQQVKTELEKVRSEIDKLQTNIDKANIVSDQDEKMMSMSMSLLIEKQKKENFLLESKQTMVAWT